MRWRSAGVVDRRAAIIVTALYALLLQAFLLTLHPIAILQSTGGVICAEHGGEAPIDDGMPCQQHPCCLPAPVAQPVAELVSAPIEVMAPPRRSSPLVWRSVAPLGPRAPPDPAVSPRGPPSA